MIEVERKGPDGAIAVVAIDRAERRNALNGETIRLLTQAFEGCATTFPSRS